MRSAARMSLLSSGEGLSGIHQAHIERRLASVASDFQHIVLGGIDAVAPQTFGAFYEGFDDIP